MNEWVPHGPETVYPKVKYARCPGATAIRGASERLVPILMTAAVTMMGLLPLALGTGEAGREIEGPMAIVIVGGLVTSTLLNLLVLPPLTLKWAVWRERTG